MRESTRTEPPAWQGKPAIVSPALRRGTLRDLDRGLKRQWKRYRRQLDKCQEEFSETAVHGLRVETRRLLSNIGLFGGFLSPKRVARMERSLKHCLDLFDELRDTQVQVLAVKPLRARFSAARTFHEYLLKRQDRFTKAARKRARKVRIKRVTEDLAFCRKEITKALKRGAAEEAASTVLGAVTKAFEETLELKAKANARDTRTIHKTRVAFKKFRYMVEGLAGHLPGIDKAMLARMHHYQTMMGIIQDAEVLMKAFEKFARKEHVPSWLAHQFQREWQRRRDRRIHSYFLAADRLGEFWSTSRDTAPLNGTTDRKEVQKSFL